MTSTGTTGTGTDATGTSTGSTAPTAIATSTDPSGINIFTFGASATQLLWDFGQSYNRTRTATRYASAAQASEKTAAQNVVLDVRRNYFAARANRAFVEVATESLANLQRHLDQIEGFVKVGVRPEIDLAQAKTDLANGRVALIDADNAYQTSKAQLGRAIGDGTMEFEIADDELPPIDGEDLPADRLAAKAMSQRPELHSLQLEREGRELAIKSVKGGYGPRLSASGGASETGTALGDLGPAWNVGVALTWPIFQGGITRAQVRSAEADLDVTSASIDAQKLQIQVDVKQAALSLKAAKASLEANGDVVKNAEERLRLAEGRYTSGVGSAIELGDAQVAMTNARAQLVQARYRLSSARADLLGAMGQR